MSKIHINKVGLNSREQYDSISFGEKVFVEDMQDKRIPADYERIDNSRKESPKQTSKKPKKEISFDGFLEISIRLLALSALTFIVYSIFGGIVEKSELALSPFGRELGITLGLFTAISISTILFLFSKTKVKIHVKNAHMHIKSFRGINHVIPIEAIADCKVNIFRNAHSIKTFVTSKKYKINLEAGLLITFKDGRNLLIASSNSYPSNKNLVFN